VEHYSVETNEQEQQARQWISLSLLSHSSEQTRQRTVG
jgi:hypothetical protein